MWQPLLMLAEKIGLRHPQPPLMGIGAYDKALVAEWQRRAERDGMSAMAEAFRNATPASPILACGSANRGAIRLRIPADGAENDDTNPPRIAPRHLFDFSAGTDNLFRTDRRKVTLRFTVINLTNKVALYNFLSTFSGTHFVTPRAFQVQTGVTF